MWYTFKPLYDSPFVSGLFKHLYFHLNFVQGIGAHAEVDTELPRSLASVVNNTYTFHLKLTDFNFTPNHKTFTISRIFPARDLAPSPTFDVRIIYFLYVNLLDPNYLYACFQLCVPGRRNVCCTTTPAACCI